MKVMPPIRDRDFKSIAGGDIMARRPDSAWPAGSMATGAETPPATGIGAKDNTMLYELRTETLKPGTLGTMIKAASTVEHDIRQDRYGKLEGCWSTEIGPLNQVIQLWSYADFSERSRLHGELATNQRWAGEYIPLVRPLLQRQEIRLLNAVRPPIAPASTGNLYELRNYRAKPGASTQWLELFTAALPARERHSKIVGLWQTEAGQPNEVCHLWAYSSLNARDAQRSASLKEPEWQAFIANGGLLLDEMHSTIMLPAPHSPLG
jgi:NIPSNAP